jgi:hypothetical protein
MRLARMTRAAVAAGVFTAGLTVGSAAIATPVNVCLDQARFEAYPGVLTDKPARVGIKIPGAFCTDEAVTVQRANGTNRLRVPLPNINEHPDFLGTYGSFYAPVKDGAGTWQITHVHPGEATYKLPTAFTFVVKRGVKVTVPRTVKTLPGQSTTISGAAAYYTSTGALLPLPSRTVQVSGYPIGTTQNEQVLTRVRTDSAGRFRFTVKVTKEHQLYIRVWSNSSIIANGYAPVDLLFNPRPIWIDGTANPTSATVIRPGTKMSTYGHLRVMYSNGTTGPYAGQRVVVQTRPKGATAYSTVATATTTSTGYYYANWNASIDVDVRVAFISPYSTIASSYRWIRTIDVR